MGNGSGGPGAATEFPLFGMQLTDLNPHGGIGANSLFLEIGPFRLLVDAGLNPKLKGHQALPQYGAVSDGSIDAIFITHCHLDHLGSLPVAARHHPDAEIFMSPASQVIFTRMLHNSCNVMTRQREEDGISEYPLFTHGEIERLRSRIRVLPPGRPLDLHAYGETLDVTAHLSGHVPGAIALEFVHRQERIFHTGDVLFTPQRIMPGADLPKHECDILITETTRGLTERSLDAARADEVARLLLTIEATLQAGGSVLIPTFAFGRMQEMLSLLHDAQRSRTLPRCPVYVSGLGVELADLFDEVARKTRTISFRKKVLKELNVKPVPDNMRPGRNPGKPGIFVVSSGMMVEYTPSYGVAASLLHDPKNTLCFVGYCDPDTPGGKLLRTAPGDPFAFTQIDYEAPLNARVDRFDLSGHADRDELVDYALQTSPRTIVLTHGDPQARAWFTDALLDLTPSTQVVDPEPLTVYRV